MQRAEREPVRVCWHAANPSREFHVRCRTTTSDVLATLRLKHGKSTSQSRLCVTVTIIHHWRPAFDGNNNNNNNQLAKIPNCSFGTSHSARNLGFIFDEHLTFADQITALSKACCYHIRQLRCIRPYLDSSTTCTIAASIVHSKLD